MSSWKETPFSSIQEAHETVTALGLNPTEITQSKDDKYYSITIYEGRDTIYLAQSIDGGPVREKTITSKRRVKDPRIPTFKEEDRLLAGPWIRSDHNSFEEVEAYWRRQYVNFSNVERLNIILYRIGDDEYEYTKDTSGIHTRVLHKRK